MSAYFVGHLLQGRRYLVTGATGGAGSKVCEQIERCGGLVVMKPRNQDAVGDQFDGVFHAAGVERLEPLRDLGADKDDPALALAINLLAMAGARRGLVKDGGSIVLMSSVAAVRGTPGMAAYSAGKAAIEALARSAAVELAPRKIRVNCIRAGAFRSPMHERISKRLTDEQHQAYFERHPLGFGTTDDIAQAAIFLLSDASRWVTGACFPIDGGYTAR